MKLEKSEYQHLVQDLISLTEESKHNVVTYANSSLTILKIHRNLQRNMGLMQAVEFGRNSQMQAGSRL